MINKIINLWLKYFAHIIPSVATMGYLILLILLHYKKISFTLIQDSCFFVNMLETFVVFMSIVLSIFGFLIPAFLGAKEKSETMNYFFKYADKQMFMRNLKNIVANGLVIIFITCVLFLNDILMPVLCNVIMLIWIWMVFFFMCSSYRYISIIINLLMVEKETFVQEVANEVSENNKKIINAKVPKI